MVPLTCVCPCKTNESRTTGIVHQVGTRLWFAKGDHREFLFADVQIGQGWQTDDIFILVFFCFHFFMVHSCCFPLVSQSKRISRRKTHRLGALQVFKSQRSSITTWTKDKENPPELYLKFRPHAELNMYVFFCLLVFFSFLFGSNMNTQSTPLTPGITWCWVISESFAFLHPQVSAQPFPSVEPED